MQREEEVAAGVADENEHGKFASRIKSALDATKANAKKLSDEADWVFGRRTWRVLGVVALFAVVVALLFLLLNWYVAPTKPGDKKELVLALAQILAGTALLSGLYFTWRSVQVNRDQQVTERFTRAIDQLGATDDKGNKMLEIRLGGIYALERIAWDSPQRDYSTVMEILTAYVRENTPRTPGLSEGSSEAESTPNEATGEADEGMKQPAAPEPRDPTADIQAILDVLSRAQDRVPEEYRTRLDLRGAFLQGAHLQDANLERAILFAASLQGAYLFISNLQGAKLLVADLQDADLRGAKLQDADLQGAKVTDEQLANTRSLQGATMPDGQKYEDWLKDKEGSGKDMEHE